MMKLTEFGRRYLRAVYLSGGNEAPVGPAEVGRRLGVSRVTALEMLKRLSEMGFGEYVAGKGLRLNRSGVSKVTEDIWRHHVMESALIDLIGINDHSLACAESARASWDMSHEVLDILYNKLGRPVYGKCGCRIYPEIDRESLKKCRWCSQ